MFKVKSKNPIVFCCRLFNPSSSLSLLLFDSFFFVFCLLNLFWFLRDLTHEQPSEVLFFLFFTFCVSVFHGKLNFCYSPCVWIKSFLAMMVKIDTVYVNESINFRNGYIVTFLQKEEISICYKILFDYQNMGIFILFSILWCKSSYLKLAAWLRSLYFEIAILSCCLLKKDR